VGPRGAGSVVGAVAVGIELDGHPDVGRVGGDRPERGREVDRAFPGNQVMVHPRGRDVLDVVMPRVGLHPRHPLRRIFAHAVGMAHVEVEAECRVLHPLGELEVLPERLDQQARLRLDEERHATVGGDVEGRHDLVVEDVGRLRTGLPRLDLAARLGGDVLCPDFGGQLQRPLRVLPADRAVVRIGVGPPGMPVGLPRVGDRIHHERIDVGDDEPARPQGLPNRLLLHLEEPRRPSVGHVGEQFDAGVAELGDPFDRPFHGHVEIRIGTERQTQRHDRNLVGLVSRRLYPPLTRRTWQQRTLTAREQRASRSMRAAAAAARARCRPSPQD